MAAYGRINIMTFHVRAVSLRARTDEDLLGFDATLQQGLVVVRGQNTVGKSLLLQSMLYGLGLEDLYTTSRQGALTRAMSFEVEWGGRTLDVRHSWVELEIANARGEVITTRRDVRGPATQAGAAHQLVRVWQEPALTSGTAEAARSKASAFYTGRPGAATEEAGFHRFLERFLGWELPTVPAYDGRSVPLYIQAVLALAYVEQKQGWGGIVPRMPTKYGIAEPLRRAAEFTLSLDVLDRATRRRAIDEQIGELERAEASTRNRLQAAAELEGGRVSFPQLPNAKGRSMKGVMRDVDLAARPEVEILQANTWMPLETVIEDLLSLRRDRGISAVLAGERPGQRSESSVTARQLREAEQALAQLSARMAALDESDNMLDMQRGALERRVSAVREERGRYNQLITLTNLGAEVASSSFSHGDCPTCHQSLADVEAADTTVMDVEASRTLLGQELETMENLLAGAVRAAETHRAVRNAYEAQAADLRGQVRSLKADLVTPDIVPSVADIQRQVSEENRLADLQRMQAQTVEDIAQWQSTRQRLAELLTQAIALGPIELTESDRARVHLWEGALREMLADFGFESVPAAEISLDDSMKPTLEGYDLGFQGSASDGVRMRWAYMLSLMETALNGSSNHPGLLMLDEPGQQGVEKSSLAALFRELLRATGRPTQVIVTTSESGASLNDWLGGSDYQLLEVAPPRLLKPVD